jgi:UDP-N-acetylmuramoylalanine-D-glutamate ligase
MNVAGKKVSIVGAAKSGLAAANYLIKTAQAFLSQTYKKKINLKPH